MIGPHTKAYVAAVLAMLLLSGGQIFLKLLALELSKTGLNLVALRQGAVSLLWLTSASFLIYVAATILWLYVLKTIDLNRAFAFASLAFVFVPLFSFIFLEKEITIGAVAGAFLIIFGILVSTSF